MKTVIDTDEYRKKSRERTAKFRQTEKGKEYTKQYRTSNEYKEWRRIWKKTEVGKRVNKRYTQSEGYKKYIKEYRQENYDRHKEYQKKSDEKYRTNPANKLKISARKAVWYAVKVGKLAHISTLKCFNCLSPATAYHHHKGYDKEHWLDVVPICRMCHEECEH